MPTRTEVLRILAFLTKRIEHEETDRNLNLEELRYLLDLDFTRTLSNIESKVDRLLERSDFGQCRLARAEGSEVAEFLVGIGGTARHNALTHINECLEGAQHLTICDPFFLQSKMTPESYAEAVETVLPQTLKSLEIFSRGGRRDKLITNALNQMFKRKGLKVNSYKVDDIHDRVWIKNYSNAYSVGTSFNGLGNKCAFILPLPPGDLRAFLAELNTRRTDLPRSRSV